MHLEDVCYIGRMTVAVILLPITLLDYCTHYYIYDIPEKSRYYPTWKRRANEQRREQEKLDAYKKTYAYKYSITSGAEQG